MPWSANHLVFAHLNSQIKRKELHTFESLLVNTADGKVSQKITN